MRIPRILIYLLTCSVRGEEINSPFYEWIEASTVRTRADTLPLFRFPNDAETPNKGPFVCRVKMPEGSKFEYLGGEVKGGKCTYGWNEPLRSEIFEVLKPLCDDGSQLSWKTEETELEYGSELMVKGKQGKEEIRKINRFHPNSYFSHSKLMLVIMDHSISSLFAHLRENLVGNMAMPVNGR